MAAGPVLAGSSLQAWCWAGAGLDGVHCGTAHWLVCMKLKSGDRLAARGCRDVFNILLGGMLACAAATDPRLLAWLA